MLVFTLIPYAAFANRHSNVVFVERIRCGEKNTNLSEIHECERSEVRESIKSDDDSEQDECSSFMTTLHEISSFKHDFLINYFANKLSISICSNALSLFHSYM